MSGEYSRPATSTNGLANGSSLPSSPATATEKMPASQPAANPSSSAALPKAVEDVMYSDIGIITLLNRLKQSIASARDFAAFLKKRSSLEEEQATGLKRLAKSQLETLRRAEVKTGSYAAQLAEVMRVHERMAENGMQFALSLSQMHEDLNELSTNMERGRKQWKHEGLDAEQKASSAESAMQKAKAKYDGFAEEYDRARTGDTKGSRRIGLKGPKSAEQYEQDLLRKTQQADAEYEERVKGAKSLRDGLVESMRPRAVKALQELVRECDGALTLQLQKFATFNEKLLLGNGLAVMPLTDPSKDSSSSQRSLRDIVYEIDNDTDFNAYMRSHVNKIPPRNTEIKYEPHPTLMPKTQKPNDRSASGPGPSGSSFSHSGGQQLPSGSLSERQQQPPPSLSLNTLGAGMGAAASQQGSTSSRYSAGGQAQQSYSSQQPVQRPSGDYPRQAQAPQLPPMMQSPTNYGAPPSQQQAPSTYTSSPIGAGPPQIPPQTLRDYSGSTGASNYNTPPYPTYPSERSASASTGPGAGSYSSGAHQQTTGSIPSGPPPRQGTLPPLRPVFGVSLDELFARDQSAVPMVVIQCILAVDTFGLDVEGIYRLSGTSSHIHTLKSQFDHNSSAIDFRNPAAFMHDVNSVATLLKQFFRDLPDPLFTTQGYGAFIEAARIEDEGQRRDALHQSINDLPDANYATLRALVLHLWRVMQNESRNRMGSANLAMCFAPSLMGTHTGSQIADASLQARVLDTILNNATAIFDED